MARALVTGGAGFLGRHLCERLLASGHEVLCLDNLLTGTQENIEAFVDHPRFRFVQHDVCRTYDMEVDRIYNLACPASPVHYQRDALHTLRTSVLGAMHALELGRRHGARVLQASTSEVYGDPLQHPQSEAYWGHVNPVGTRACYDEGKRCAETLCFDYRRQYGVPVKVVRIFNTYGPFMQHDDGRVVSNFIVQALRNEPITIYGSGEQTRAFCYVDDLVDGLVRMMESAEHVTGPINLGNPGEFTVAELAERVRDMVGSRSPISYRPLPSDDPRQRRPDITEARQQLGWEPRTPLQEGLARTIAWFEQRLGRARPPVARTATRPW
ncbi:MAG: UDP-glucuronic acid decarboxylase family protein [Thiohalomonadaceae bacterium]